MDPSSVQILNRFSRRNFFYLAGLASLSAGVYLRPRSKRFFFAAGLQENNKNYVYIQEIGDYPHQKVALPFQVHSVVQNPYHPNEIIVIEKRGPHFARINFRTGKILQLFKLPIGREFVGHGTINPVTEQLIITSRKVTHAIYNRTAESAYDPKHIYSGIYDNGLLSYFTLKNPECRFLKEINSNGSEPHQLIISLDRRSYWVANGVDFVDDGLKSCLANLSQFDSKTNELLASYQFDAKIENHLADLGHLAITKENNILLGSYIIPNTKVETGGRMVSFSSSSKEFKVFSGKGMPLKDEAFNIIYLPSEEKFLAVIPGESKLISVGSKTLKVLSVKQLDPHLDPGGIIHTGVSGRYLLLTNKGGLYINSKLEVTGKLSLPNNLFPSPHLELLTLDS